MPSSSIHLYGFTGRVYNISLSITQVCMHMSCSHLVLKVWIGPSSQEKLNHLLMAVEASSFKCCPTILYGRMNDSNHMRWLHNKKLMEVHQNCLMKLPFKMSLLKEFSISDLYTTCYFL